MQVWGNDGAVRGKVWDSLQVLVGRGEAFPEPSQAFSASVDEEGQIEVGHFVHMEAWEAPCIRLKVHSSSAEAVQVVLQQEANQAYLGEGIAVNYHPFVK